MSNLKRAIAIAVEAHAGAVDKAGAPYVLHPLRMMQRMNSDVERMVAVLHDVVEDTYWTFDSLQAENFPSEVIAALRCVTWQKGESYDQFIDRAALNPVARRVKIADLEDNMDIRRLSEIRDKDVERLRKYLASWQKLKAIPDWEVKNPGPILYS